MKYLVKVLFLLVVVLGLSGCHKSRKRMQIDMNFPANAVPTDVRIVDRVNENRMLSESVSAKIRLKLAMGEKGANVGGTLRMKRDDVVQISLVAFGLMEVGRLELTPDYFLVLDRMNHRYVKKNYDEVDFLRTQGIDFYAFQSLFWNELFLFGGKDKMPAESDFKAAEQDGDILLLSKQDSRILLNFVVNQDDARIRHTRVSAANAADSRMLDWTYSAFNRFEAGDFPGKMEMEINLASKPIGLSLELQNLRQSEGWETRTRLSDKYQELPLEQILNKIVSLAE